jgi:1,2-diacylglycerol 3-alpha-glucosyltransferase
MTATSPSAFPFATLLSERLAEFRTDLIHTHHPFLLGDTALREASTRQVPLVFTHHTLYENYVHYLPVDGEAMAEFAADVATRFANRCTAVVAPSQSVSDLIRSRGVTVPVHVIPTGIDTQTIATGRSPQARDRWDLPSACAGHRPPRPVCRRKEPALPRRGDHARPETAPARPRTADRRRPGAR